MKVSLCAVLLATAALGGCNGMTELSAHAPSGRYAGVGLYQADRTWTKMSGADKPVDKNRATIADDQVVIVVVDSRTGEVRQCGNMSGYCTGLNPWSQPLGSGHVTPVYVTEHAPEKTAERSEAAVSNTAAETDMDDPQAC